MTVPPYYMKRFRMDLDLGGPLAIPQLPDGFYWLPWEDRLRELHADVKCTSFEQELDCQLFPNLGHKSGCQELMRAITQHDGFCPQATWLVANSDCCVGTVQGLTDSSRWGAIQNIGVVPAYRGLGLGEALLLKALHGFQAVGMRRAYLEVTAQNTAAVKLYRKHGFRRFRTLYKVVVRAHPSPVGMGI